MSTATLTQMQRDGEAILAAHERARLAEEAKRPKPIPDRFAGMTPDQVESILVGAWDHGRGGGDFTVDPLTQHVPLYMAALDGANAEAKAGAEVGLTLAILRRDSVNAQEDVSPHVAPMLAAARYAVDLAERIAEVVAQVEAAARGKADAEDVLSRLVADDRVVRLPDTLRDGNAAAGEVAARADGMLVAYRSYGSWLAGIEERLGKALDVPRLSPAAVKALERAARLPQYSAFSKGSRPASVEVLREVVRIFGGNWWTKPSEFPQEASITSEKPKRGGVLSRLLS